MPAFKSKKIHQAQFFKERLIRINGVIGRLEGEVEKAVSKFMKRGEKSSRLLKRNFDEIVEKISSSDIYSRAAAKKDELQREIRHLADEVVAKLKKFDIQVANPLLKEVRINFEQIVDKLQSSNLVETAKERVVTTRDQVLHVLSIPSQKEVDDLSKKVVTLERKLKVITQKAA
ncbi:MAG: hypothetical protein HYU99_04120 [Deltaproteobacteria bacterium]|nr:hypothetical protein [Deltaproteobacteria bacterium]